MQLRQPFSMSAAMFTQGVLNEMNVHLDKSGFVLKPVSDEGHPAGIRIHKALALCDKNTDESVGLTFVRGGGREETAYGDVYDGVDVRWGTAPLPEFHSKPSLEALVADVEERVHLSCNNTTRSHRLALVKSEDEFLDYAQKAAANRQWVQVLNGFDEGFHQPHPARISKISQNIQVLNDDGRLVRTLSPGDVVGVDRSGKALSFGAEDLYVSSVPLAQVDKNIKSDPSVERLSAAAQKICSIVNALDKDDRPVEGRPDFVVVEESDGKAFIASMPSDDMVRVWKTYSDKDFAVAALQRDGEMLQSSHDGLKASADRMREVARTFSQDEQQR